jgi:hypothetical protein
MKKLIFILFAFLAISTTAQTIPVHPTIKLTKLTAGGSNDDILTVGTDKVVKKVSKSSLVPDISGKENTIAPGTSSQYWRGDKTWAEFPNVSLYPLEFNIANRTVWNNGGGNIFSNTAFGDYALVNNTSGTDNTVYGFAALMNNTLGNRNTAYGFGALGNNTLGDKNTAIGDQAGHYCDGFSVLTTAYDSVFIGSRSYPGSMPDEQCTNAIVIGANTIGAGSNTATLGNTLIQRTILRGTINTTSMPVYADNAAATTGGLAVGDQYRTSTGVLMVRY